MNIRRIQTYPLFYSLPIPYGDANGMKHYRSCYLIRITADNGVEGWGECIDWLPALHKGFEDRIIPYLIGKPVAERIKWVQHVKQWHARAASAVSMALTEILAKASSLSIGELWGGTFRSKVPVYASFQSYSDEPDWQKRSLHLIEAAVQQGFAGFKVKIGGKTIAEDQKHIAAVQLLLQPLNKKLALDANESYDTAAMMAWQPILQSWSNWLWIEEPLAIKHYAQYARLRDRLSVPIAGGENMASPSEYIPFLEQQSLDFITPDPQHLSGIDPYRTTLSMIRSFGVRVTPHTYDGALSRLYAIWAQACMEPWSKMEQHNIEPVEWDVMDNPFTGLLPLQPQQGEVILPQGPGIGLEFDLDKLEFYRWDGSSY